MTGNNLHVVFGAGPVGLAAVTALVERGKTVRVVNRSGKAAVPTGVEVVAGDGTDQAFTSRVSQGAAVVYNCTNAPYTEWPQLFPPLNTAIWRGAAAAGARLVVMDNVYMYGPTHGQPLTEATPVAATTRKGRVRAAMAQELLDAHRRGDVQVAIGRASDFFGPGVRDSAMGERVFAPLLNGKAAQVLGNPNLPHTYHYVPDVGRALATLGEHEQVFGQVWHLPSAETISTRAFIERVAAAAGVAPSVQVPPSLLVRGMGLFNPTMRELAEMLYEFEEPHVVDHRQYVVAFGNHATPLDQAIQTTVSWYRQHAASTAVAA